MLVSWYRYNHENDAYEPIPTPEFEYNTAGRTIG